MYRQRKKQKKRRVATRRRNRQTGGFLNCYDFAYTVRDTVNQAAKVSPGVIKNSSNGINNLAQQRIDQSISKGGSLACFSQNS